MNYYYVYLQYDLEPKIHEIIYITVQIKMFV